MKEILFEADELAPGEMKAVQVAGTPVVVVRNFDGQFYGYRNLCPHRGATMTDGRVMNRVVCTEDRTFELDSELVLKCPWHNYEFHVASGKCVIEGDPGLRAFPVTVEDGKVVSTR